MTAVSNAGIISWIERRMWSLPGSLAIEPVLVVVIPCGLGDVVWPGPRWTLRSTVKAWSMMWMSTLGEF